MRIRFSIIFSLCFLFILTVNAKSNERPDWVEFEGYHKDFTNSYVSVVSAEGTSIQDAQKNAEQQKINRQFAALGERYTRSSSQFNSSFKLSQESKKIVSRDLDSYVEELPSGKYVCYLLVQYGRAYNSQLEPIKITNKYPFSARVFVPGCAQIYKGQTGKGAGFIVGEALFVGGIVASECLKTNYINLANNTHSQQEKEYYYQCANYCVIGSGVSIAGTAILYIWSLIDGICADGKTRIVEDQQLSWRFSPTIDTSFAGVSLALQF